jgi:DNA-binding MarR family transcriptional regulator
MGNNGLHPGQEPVMFALWRKDGQVQKELAEVLQLAPATVTVTLRRLEKAGFVERRRDPVDQRVSRVYLTARSNALRDQVEACIRATNEESLADFTPEEIDLLRRFLIRVTNNLSAALHLSR